MRPSQPSPFEVRFETPPGQQAQVDFARFTVTFADEPSAIRIVWLFSLVLGHSRLIWARFAMCGLPKSLVAQVPEPAATSPLGLTLEAPLLALSVAGSG